MLMLASQPNALFLGQGVAYDGVATYRDLTGVPNRQRLEMPVAEELQVGICIGLALQGYLPVSIFPRVDFLMRAMDQLVNHLDKLAEMSVGKYHAKVILRARVGTRTPLDPGPQHRQNHFAGLQLMLPNTAVVLIDKKEQILPTYREAVGRRGSTLVVEAV